MVEINEISNLLQPFSFIIIIIFTNIILTTFIYKWYYSKLTTINKSSSSSSSPPPSPPKLPIIGNLHQLGLHPHRTLQALSRRHGPLMLLHFGTVPVLVVSSADMAEKIMKTHDLIFSDRPRLTAFDKLLYGSRDVSSAPYGEYWRQVRCISVLHLLSTKRVESFRDVREEETKTMVEKIEEYCCNCSSSSSSSSEASSGVNLSQVLMKLTNDVVCRVAFGRKYSDGDDESGREFKKLLGDFVELLGSFYIGDYVPLLSWLRFVNGLDWKLNRVAKEFDDFLEQVVQEHVDDFEKKRESEEYKDFTVMRVEYTKNKCPTLNY